ncbi:MAG: FRG domain-containing protein [Candidatus Methylumidiphilus sp.]
MKDALRNLSITITTPIELISASLQMSNGNWWFRGQGDESWSLESTLKRSSTDFNVPDEAIREREKVIYNLFSERMHLFDATLRHEELNEFEIHALIRHYGGPSRLLDVTSSILIAAHFAIHDSPKDKDAVIWAFNFNETVEKGWQGSFLNDSKTYHQVFLAKPKRLNERINAQNGAFLFSNCLDTL